MSALYSLPSLLPSSFLLYTCYKLRLCGVGLSFLPGVKRQLVSGMGEEEMGRGGVVVQKHRRVEGSTRMEVNTKVEQRTYLGQLYGQTLEKSRMDLGGS